MPSRDALTQAIGRMKNNGVNWYEIGVAWYMPSLSSISLGPVNSASALDPNVERRCLPTVSDARLREIIQLFTSNAIDVYLRPVVDINGVGWRGYIAPSDWTIWFASYKAFIEHYAALAAATGVRMLCVGLEMNSAVRFIAEWRTVIAAARAKYSGWISYDCGGVLYNGDESAYTTKAFGPEWTAMSIGEFASDLDFVGVDWYPQIALNESTSVDEMEQNVRNIAAAFLQPVYQRYGKKIVFGEIDYSSVTKTAVNPLKYRQGGRWSEKAQADAYEAVFRVLSSTPYFAGMFPTSFYLSVSNKQQDTTNAVWYKQAESVISSWYAGKLPSS